MDEEINWLKFRAEVAKTMLPIIYRELCSNNRLVTNREQAAAAIAADIAGLLEHELKNLS